MSCYGILNILQHFWSVTDPYLGLTSVNSQQWAYIIYIVVKHRYFPSTVKSLHESMDRTLHEGNTAYNFGEIITKHGRDEWLKPLVDELGPYAQLQLIDAANLLEVFAKSVI